MLGSWESFFRRDWQQTPLYISYIVLMLKQDIWTWVPLVVVDRSFIWLHRMMVWLRGGVSFLATTHFIPGFPYNLEHNYLVLHRTQQRGQEDILSIAPQGILLSDWKMLIIIVHSVLLNSQIHGYTNEVPKPTCSKCTVQWGLTYVYTQKSISLIKINIPITLLKFPHMPLCNPRFLLPPHPQATTNLLSSTRK